MNPRRTLRWPAALLALGVLLAACGGAASDDGGSEAGAAGGDEAAGGGEQVELVLATGAPSQLSIGQGQAFFAEQLQELTDGRVTVQVHLDGSLYNERTSLEAVRGGAIDIGGASNANMGAFTEALFWMDFPFLFESTESLMEVMNSDFGQETIEQVEQDGFKVIARLQNGAFRSVVNNRQPVVTPDDLSGLKMRTTASPVEIAMFEEWGANPTSVDWGETYDALSQGVVDGEFVMWTWLDSANHCEVLNYGTNGPFVIGLQFMVMDPAKYEALPEDVRAAIDEAGRLTEEHVAEIDEEAIAEARASCENEHGVEMVDLDAGQIEPWRERSEAVWNRFSEEVPQETIDTILEIQQGA